MDERFIKLLEDYFEGKLSDQDKIEFEKLLEKNDLYKNEFEEQKQIKEALNSMKLKEPSEEVWDSYWEKTYNKLERSIGWLAIFIGMLLLLGFASVEVVDQFFNDNSTPIIIKIGTVALVFGVLVLFFSVIREKFFTYKSDKYKEIRR